MRSMPPYGKSWIHHCMSQTESHCLRMGNFNWAQTVILDLKLIFISTMDTQYSQIIKILSPFFKWNSILKP